MPRPSDTKPKRPARRIPAGATLRRQFVTCGRCPRLHGPYWYAFWWSKGATRSAYVGGDAAMERLLRDRGRSAFTVSDEAPVAPDVRS